jgi:hypothetical protein
MTTPVVKELDGYIITRTLKKMLFFQLFINDSTATVNNNGYPIIDFVSTYATRQRSLARTL